MPITVLPTISMSRVTAEDADIQLPADKQEAFYSLIESFLLLNPSPSDEHMHGLASAVGIDPETFEALIYKFFGSVINQQGDLLSDAEDSEDASDLEEVVDENAHADLMARLTSSNVDDSTMNLFDTDDLITSSDADGQAASEDGVFDQELLGMEDTLKDAADSDGAIDEEQLEENLGETSA